VTIASPRRRPLGRVAFGKRWLALGVAAGLFGPAAWAAMPALAESLYQDGRDLLTAGRTAEACEKFAESHRLDPAAGTLLNLAACNERTCTAQVAATPDQIKNAGSVTLGP